MNDHQPDRALTLDMPPADADLQAVRSSLAEFNVSHSTMDQGQRTAIFRRDWAGQIVASIYGWLWGATPEIVLLWIDEPLRGQGLGQQLLAQMEAAGRSLGARLAMLETFSFQAPAFYQRCGYETFGVIEGYDRQHAKHFMRKDLV